MKIFKCNKIKLLGYKKTPPFKYLSTFLMKIYIYLLLFNNYSKAVYELILE